MMSIPKNEITGKNTGSISMNDTIETRLNWINKKYKNVSLKKSGDCTWILTCSNNKKDKVEYSGALLVVVMKAFQPIEPEYRALMAEITSMKIKVKK